MLLFWKGSADRGVRDSEVMVIGRAKRGGLEERKWVNAAWRSEEAGRGKRVSMGVV